MFIYFLVHKPFTLLLFCVWDYWESNQYTEDLVVKLQDSNQNSSLSLVSLIGIWTTPPRSTAWLNLYIRALHGEAILAGMVDSDLSFKR